MEDRRLAKSHFGIGRVNLPALSDTMLFLQFGQPGLGNGEMGSFEGLSNFLDVEEESRIIPP